MNRLTTRPLANTEVESMAVVDICMNRPVLVAHRNVQKHSVQRSKSLDLSEWKHVRNPEPNLRQGSGCSRVGNFHGRVGAMEISREIEGRMGP